MKCNINKESLIVILFSVLFLSVTKCLPAHENIFHKKALHIIDLQLSGDFDQIIAMATEDFKEKVTADQIEEIWEGLQSQLGKYIGPGDYTYTESDGVHSITQILRFEHDVFAIKVFYNEEAEITGYFFQPAPPEEMAPPPDYADETLFEEIEMHIPTADVNLQAKLTIPKEGDNFPVVILVHGSGPNDMDETIGPNKVFRDLAWGLSSKGIAVLRYNKRTLNHASTINLNCFTMKEKAEEDVHFAVKLAKTIDKIDQDRIIVLGHSLGGLAAPRIAKNNDDIDGIIIMAANSRKLYDIIEHQYDYLFSLQKTTEEMQEHLKFAKQKLQKIREGDFDETTPASELMIWNACFWQDIKEYDQIETAAQISQPIYILQGERDYQIPMREFYGWRSGLGRKQNASFKWYPGLNHLFIYGTGKSTPDEYSLIGNVSEEVVNDIAEWVLSL